ncbi:MAG: hypothetical protein WA667_23485 [Candidatus Nitrosopolaris sp.]
MKLFFFCYNGNRQDDYIHTDQQYLFHKSTVMLSLLMSALLILSIGYSFQSPVFAQISSTSANNNIVKNNNFASSFQQVVAAAPLITNISSKGIYKVQLGWSTPISLQSLPKSGFSPYILFLSATASPATSKTIPNRANGGGLATTIGGSGTQYNVPGSIKRIVPIKSFDMTIYDSHGKVLWNKVNQKPSAGLKLEQVVFPKGYNGNITISIHDIKSTLHNVPTDSVDFAAKVV